MRTTIDLSEALFRRVKVCAALNGLELKDLIVRYIEQGLEREVRPSTAGKPGARQRSELPVIAQAAKGIPIPATDSDELARTETEEDLAKHGRSVGR